ncbi:hypothetical protein CLV59_10613 [Chitinophaga dinghuensis]|uniref:Uncharacterized protein n=1 Tax=Chitinophaga dinghuensis TaxID=1539050 RepID=A0A327VUJ8_9BACT|nr:hypothetical protein [Chitinophaga dinghuensis]RAJ78953.1 hypothetical protein CLV59_10613 [Chitinophaga dinghuensis]
MVSINTTSKLLINDVYSLLTRKIQTIEPNSLEGIFAAWMLEDLKLPDENKLIADFSVMNYRDVAKLALWIELAPETLSKYSNLLEEGLQRVSGRTDTLMGQPAPFSNDALALLALAIGARRLGGDILIEISKWLIKFVNPSNENLSQWKRLFLFATLRLIAQPTEKHGPIILDNLSDLELALNTKYENLFDEIDLDTVYQTIITRSLEPQIDPEIAICQMAALTYIAKKLPAISLTKPTIEQVVSLLNNIPSGFKRWPWEEKAKTTTSTAQKWDIQNEYHVQSLVYFLLAPIFPDIEQEFSMEQLGQLNARADIGIPSLNVIIEIKFLRQNTPFTKMLEEVAADASLYFKKDGVYLNKYNKMLVLLWDNSRRNQEHREFIKAACQLLNIEAAVVLSRPGNMPIQKREHTEDYQSKPNS